MTEDDTFEALCRLPIMQVYQEWVLTPANDWYSDESIEWFKSRGWDKEEWYREYLGYTKPRKA